MNKSRLAVALLSIASLLASACVNSAQSRLTDRFNSTYSEEPWFDAVDGIEVNGEATIVIRTKLDPLDPNLEELGVEICESMARTSPSEDEVIVNITRLIPGEQNVDGSYEDPRPQEVGIAETVSFVEDSCEAEMYPTWIEDQREALEQLDS